jgi:hypothetical protein
MFNNVIQQCYSFCRSPDTTLSVHLSVHSIALKMIKSIALYLVLVLSSSVEAFAPPRPAFRPRVVAATASPTLLLQPGVSSFALRATETSEDETDTTALMENSANYEALKAPALDECEPEEELSESKRLMKQVKDAGVAGIISYALWEFAFWAISVPVVFVGYREVTGHWPDINNKDDVGKLGAEAFAFVNFARFAVPLRIGLALSTTPWIQENIVDRFFKKEDNCEPEVLPDVSAANDSDPSDEEEEREPTKQLVSRLRSLFRR